MGAGHKECCGPLQLREAQLHSQTKGGRFNDAGARLGTGSRLESSRRVMAIWKSPLGTRKWHLQGLLDGTA